MTEIIVNFLGFEDLVELMVNYPEVAPVVMQRIYETSCVVYCLLLVMIYLVVCWVFRAFLKRA